MPVYDINGDGAAAAFDDGLMIVKYLLGQRGDELTNSGGLIPPGSTRTTPEEIQGYIEFIYPRLDVDGNGEVAFSSDGLLILLYMIGFRDTNLISPDGGKLIVEPGALRYTADEIEAYIATMVA